MSTSTPPYAAPVFSLKSLRTLLVLADPQRRDTLDGRSVIPLARRGLVTWVVGRDGFRRARLTERGALLAENLRLLVETEIAEKLSTLAAIGSPRK